MEVLTNIIYFFAYPLNWLLFDLKILLMTILSPDIAGFLAYYIVYVLIYALSYSRLVENISIIYILTHNIGLHIATVVIVAVAGLFTNFTPSYGDDNSWLTFVNFGVLCLGLLAIKSISYNVNVVSLGVSQVSKNDKFN